MIFSEKLIPQIVAGTKTQTRRLVKENEELSQSAGQAVISGAGKLLRQSVGLGPLQVFNYKTRRIRYGVGKVYSIQNGRGKPTIKWCSDCRKVFPNNLSIHPVNDCVVFTEQRLYPLKIRITGIRQQKLLDIDETDARQEGFSNKIDFLRTFCELNRIPFVSQWPLPEVYKHKFESVHQDNENKTITGWGISIKKNPFVWVLDFEKII